MRTDIAGFFGFAERGPLPDRDETDPGKRTQAAVKITSWNDFRLKFGGFLPYSYLAYAVRGFFATGGKECYVVRVGAAAKKPATAVLPLPAAITSRTLANLAVNSSAGDTQIAFDADVDLAPGACIVVGDPSLNPQLSVASVIDQRTITVQPALGTTYSAGDPVFALSGPAVAAPVTSVAAATTVGQTRIQLDCSQVLGIQAGCLVALGDPINGECVSVASVVDDQFITVQPALQSLHPVGEPVYPVSGSALTSSVAAGASNLQVSNGAFQPDDLVSVEGNGIREIRVVTSTPSTSSIQLGRALQFGYDVGALVRKYETALTATALSPGEWGNHIKLQIVALDPGDAVTHFSLRVTVDQGADPTQPMQQEFYPLLSLDPNDPSPSDIYAPCVVQNMSALIQLELAGAPFDCKASPRVTPPQTFLLSGVGPLATYDLYLEGGSDGGLPAQSYAEPPDAETQDFQDALDVLGLVDEIAILCCPDAAGPLPPINTNHRWSMSAIQQAMVDQCVNLQYRVAVLDTPMSLTPNATMPLQPAQAVSWLKQQAHPQPATRFAAVYYPWLSVPDELGVEGPNRRVPPCGHVAGAYAFTDNNFGVQKPPANVELHFVSDVELAVTDQQQGFLNQQGINAIRPIPGRGIRIWGARSISTDSDWIYIHTRRLMSMIEDSVEKASRWVVFQNNDDDLRRMLTHSLNVFLESIRLTGGLKGLRAADSYFVKCDSTNNPPATIDAGQLVCQVGVAIAAPMEFLVFDIRRSVAGAQVVEA